MFSAGFLLYNVVMTNIQRVLGFNVRKLRLAKGMTQAALADKADTVGNYIALIENAAKFPSADMIERLASALEVDSVILFMPITGAFTNPWDWNKDTGTS
jgi:transcriptional regulator with XRE-family HTH domain